MILEKMRETRMAARVARDIDVAAKLGVIIGDIEADQYRTGMPMPDAKIVAMLKKFKENCAATGDEIGEGLVDLFIPRQLTDDELESVIDTIIAEHNATTIGAVMKELSGSFAGRYDGKLAQSIIKNKLNL